MLPSVGTKGVAVHWLSICVAPGMPYPVNQLSNSQTGPPTLPHHDTHVHLLLAGKGHTWPFHAFVGIIFLSIILHLSFIET